MTNKRKGSCLKIALWAVLGLSGLCLLLVGISALVNTRMPNRSDVIERLSPAQKARIREAYHLRQAVGDQIAPGWSQAEIPMIVYNEEYAFLIGMENPSDGWTKVPRGPHHGSAWELVTEDDIDGQVYYRQKLANPNATPQAFTVQVGDRWVTSMTTYEWTRIQLVEQFRQDLPGPIRPFFPYPIVVNLFLDGSDLYISLLLHETMHAYQGMQAPERLAAAENANLDWDRSYPYDDEAMEQAWQAELDCLRDAVRAADQAETQRLASRFLDLRQSRREAAHLAAELVDLERLREWEEGFAKYSELTVYRMAAQEDYVPLPEMEIDLHFSQYSGFSGRWSREVDQISFSTNSEDVRFYYSGMAQAVLLDRLMPGWKSRLFEDGVWLEDLLAEAIQTTP